MSARPPTIIFGAPHYQFSVMVHSTGDAEIDQGVGRVLGRQDGVLAVSSRPGAEGTVYYDVAVKQDYSGGVGLILQRSTVAVEEYYSGEGVLSFIHVGRDL